MGGLGQGEWMLGAHKVVGVVRSLYLGELNRGSMLEVAVVQSMGWVLGAQRMAHLEHLDPAKKDTKKVRRWAEMGGGNAHL